MPLDQPVLAACPSQRFRMARVPALALRQDRGDAMDFAVLAKQAAAIQITGCDVPDSHQPVRFFRVFDLTLPRSSFSSPSLPIASSGCAGVLRRLKNWPDRVRA